MRATHAYVEMNYNQEEPLLPELQIQIITIRCHLLPLDGWNQFKEDANRNQIPVFILPQNQMRIILYERRMLHSFHIASEIEHIYWY